MVGEPTGPPPVVPRPTVRSHGRAATVVGLVCIVLAAVLLLRLGDQDRKGPAHMPVSLPNGAPATLYIPRNTPHNLEFPFQPAPDRRPPLVVVAHGYMADQNIMSSIARSLARAGYGVMTFDFRGHGANTHPFEGELDGDLNAALDWAGRSPDVDGSRVALLGHSMGAEAALEFASRDPRPKAVVPLSGGNLIDDIRVPPNVLLIASSGDPKPIRDRQARVERYLAGRTNVHRIVVQGKDHVTELWSSRVIDESVRWFDSALGVHRTSPPPGLADPRLGTAALYLLVATILLGFVGWLAGRLVPPLPTTTTVGSWVLLVLALLLALPLLAVGPPGLLPLSEDSVVTSLAVAGGLLWAMRWLARRSAIAGSVPSWVGTGEWLPLRSVLVPGLAAGAAFFVLLNPLGAVFHRLIPTPERLVLWIAVGVLVLPFFAAFEAIVRRGTVVRSIGWGVLGRAVLLAVLYLGVASGAFAPVVGIVVPLLFGLFLLLEVFAATAYASGRNTALIAVVDAVFVAWIVTATIPVL